MQLLSKPNKHVPDYFQGEHSVDGLDSLNDQQVSLQLLAHHSDLPRSPLQNIENYNEARISAGNTAATGFQSDSQKKATDFGQKNLERLEALKAKKAQEHREMEEQREKTRKRQEKLKNLILKEAQDNRRLKEEQKQKQDLDAKAVEQVIVPSK